MAKPIDAEERFFPRLKRNENNCWIWTGKKCAEGYGVFEVNKKQTLVHRFSYQLLIGEIPAFMTVCHLCSFRECVNPDHLFISKVHNLMTFQKALENVSIPENKNLCWIWKGYCNKDNYGIMGENNKHILAHRYFFKHCNGTISKGLSVCHICDNPPCVNPKHLFLGTAKDNCNDRMVKGRSVNLIGEDHGKAKLKNSQVREIKEKLRSTKTIKEIAKEYKVCKSTISHIKNGRQWKHIKELKDGRMERFK